MTNCCAELLFFWPTSTKLQSLNIELERVDNWFATGCERVLKRDRVSFSSARSLIIAGTDRQSPWSLQLWWSPAFPVSKPLNINIIVRCSLSCYCICVLLTVDLRNTWARFTLVFVHTSVINVAFLTATLRSCARTSLGMPRTSRTPAICVHIRRSRKAVWNVSLLALHCSSGWWQATCNTIFVNSWLC